MTDDRKRINIKSEIKELKKVLLHRPGEEVENITPDSMQRLLFDDIPYLEIAQQEHDTFAEILRINNVDVVYLHELVSQVLQDTNIKEQFIKQFIEESNVKNKQISLLLYNYLNSFQNTEELVRKTMAGISKGELVNLSKKNLKDYITDDYPFIVDPMPNLYFTRDPFASIGNGISMNKMYSVTRNRETIYSHYIFKYHKEYAQIKRWYDRDFDFSIEGGDILNLSNKILAIGVSQRTIPEAIEKIAKEVIFNEESEIETVLAFDIPKTRAFMHLDTVFTQIDYDKFTIHPGIQGPLTVYELTKGDSKEDLKITQLTMKLEYILAKYLDIEKVSLIPCGGGDKLIADREQWNDGSNTLCIRPGEVIVYSRNYVTNALLEQHGIKTYVMPSSELSRGRGGPRCMSMPLLRAD